jgi:hypothetical protein
MLAISTAAFALSLGGRPVAVPARSAPISMANKYTIAPSILSADFARLGEVRGVGWPAPCSRAPHGWLHYGRCSETVSQGRRGDCQALCAARAAAATSNARLL